MRYKHQKAHDYLHWSLIYSLDYLHWSLYPAGADPQRLQDTRESSVGKSIPRAELFIKCFIYQQ